MSVGEVVGLAIMVGLLGAIAGGLLTALLFARGGRQEASRTRRVDALSRWLAARWTLNRAAASFILAFRALASEPRDSSLWALRTDEAQRTRARLFAALRDLDLAEAALVAWTTEPAILEQLERLARVTPEELCAAVNGDDPSAARLIHRLRGDDRRAIALARAASAGIAPGPSRLREGLGRFGILARSIVDQWSRR